MFSIKSVYITVPHNSHSTILCVLASMVYVALRQNVSQWSQHNEQRIYYIILYYIMLYNINVYIILYLILQGIIIVNYSLFVFL